MEIKLLPISIRRWLIKRTMKEEEKRIPKPKGSNKEKSIRSDQLKSYAERINEKLKQK